MEPYCPGKRLLRPGTFYPQFQILLVDCVRLYVLDPDAGLAFYCDRSGHELIWRTETSAGLRLRLPELNAELILQTETKDRK
jgi:hypothetical protein